MRVDKSVTVVVPLVSAHDRFVPDLVRQLSVERDVISSVILARSSIRKGTLSHLLRTVENVRMEHGLKIEVLATPRQQLAGQNRNRGWRHVSTPFTAFLDADDEYAPDRLSRLIDVAKSEESDLVLHDFLLKESETEKLLATSWSTEDLVRTEGLYQATFTQGRNRTTEGLMPGDTNIVVPPNRTHHRNVHHGHVLVRTDLRCSFSYSNLYPGEDGQFCRDILWAGKRVTYVPARLSAYRPSLSAENSTSFFLKSQRRLSRLTRNAFGERSGW